ncbi:hypothetical protein DY000_02043780 [Brassica cretica]|uniref:Neprosin domain-containing protein n=1 Tax=Brassica cretica TaxID=69181 RepID=A0ABQ7BR64_BRACR|nr:hypothetical protein DY000_02043780 [Brassica cretica]
MSQIAGHATRKRTWPRKERCYDPNEPLGNNTIFELGTWPYVAHSCPESNPVAELPLYHGGQVTHVDSC